MKKSLGENCLKKASLLACLLFGSCIWAMAQQVSVSGSVKDPAGEPLPGVNIPSLDLLQTLRAKITGITI